jgi:uncharacterized protein
LEKASAQGNGEASYNLGVMYEAGLGVAEDHVRGTRFLERAAEQRDKKAPQLFAIKYAQGVGIPKDYVIAHAWANIGAAYGDEQSKKFREELEISISRDERLHAQRTAQEWTHGTVARPTTRHVGYSGPVMRSIASRSLI